MLEEIALKWKTGSEGWKWNEVGSVCLSVCMFYWMTPDAGFPLTWKVQECWERPGCCGLSGIFVMVSEKDTSSTLCEVRYFQTRSVIIALWEQICDNKKMNKNYVKTYLLYLRQSGKYRLSSSSSFLACNSILRSAVHQPSTETSSGPHPLHQADVVREDLSF